MLKTAAVLFLLTFLIPSPAFANTDIDVSGNGSGSHSSVTVSNTASSGSNHTDIKMETNGEVKEYHGDGTNIHLESGSGQNSVNITNFPQPTSHSTNSDTSILNEVNIETNGSASASPSAEVTIIPSNTPDVQTQTFDLFGLVKNFLENLFK